MKKCIACGFENTDLMNFCLECGEALKAEPKMVIPLDSLSGSEKPSEQVTEDFEKETVVNNRFPIQQDSPNYNTPPAKKSSNAKIFLAIGAGFVAIVGLISIAAAGIILYTIQSQKEPRRIVKKRSDITEVPTPYPDKDILDISSDKKKKEKTDTKEKTIIFPTPKNPTKRSTYKVRSVPGWQLSEIKTVSLENFRITVSGRVNLKGIEKRVSAKGVKGHKDRRIIKKFPTGALLMRTHYPDGKHSNIQQVSVGEYWQNYPNETGKIEFLINDNSPENNKGDFTIRFRMINVPKK